MDTPIRFLPLPSLVGVLAPNREITISEKFSGENYALIFVRDGLLRVHVGRKAIDLPAGSALLIKPGQKFGGDKASSEDLRAFWVRFSAEQTGPKRPQEYASIPQTATLRRPDRMLELFMLMMDYQEEEILHHSSARHLLAQILCEIASSDEEVVRRQPDSLTLVGERGKAFIRTHCEESMEVEDIARAVGCSPGYLRRAFRVCYGYSPTEFLFRIRFHKARELLIETNVPIAEIAHVCGFGDSAYFSRMFKSRNGTTPREFRKLFSRAYVVSEF